MINLFELSTGMPGTKLLNGRSRREGSPVRRNQPDLKETADFSGVYIDDRQAASGLRKSYSSKESGGTPMKMLIAQEMSHETESRRKPASIVARLMGLDDDLPAQQLVLPATKKKSKRTILSGTIWGHRQQEVNYFDNPLSCDTHPFPNEREYKDAYEDCHQPSRANHLHGQPLQKARCDEILNEKRMDLVRQKFIEAKSLATDEKLLQSKEFQDALEVLSSNRDLFLKFLEEPDSLFSKQVNEFPMITSTPQTRCITVLKPSKSIEKNGEEQMKRQQYPVLGVSIWERNKPQRVPNLNCAKEDKVCQPTRIVVLKPSPAMTHAHDLKSMVTPPITSTELIGQNDFYGSLEDTEADIGSREVVREVTGQPERCHRRDESLLSSACSYGYGGDESSFNKSENKYIEEEGDFSDLEIVTPTSHHSWDYIHRFGSPYSGSSFSKASYSPESLVTREAKKRLSERWAIVASNEAGQEEVQVLRSPSTLGEMLAIPDLNKEENGERRLASSSHSCGTEDELRAQATCSSIGRKRDGEEERTLMNLSRSKSVPVSSSTYEDVDLDIQDSNSQDSKSTTLSEISKLKNGKSFFKGKVSNFFFSRSKKQGRKKSTPSPSVCSENKSESPSETSLISLLNESPVKNIEEVIENASSSTSVRRSELGTLSFKAILSLEKPISYESPTTNRDQPSPTSVLDASFEDVSGNEPHLSGSVNAANQEPLSRSSPIGSVARSLSWEDTHLDTPSPNPSKLYKAFSEEDDEDERYMLVQRILSHASLANGKSNTVLSQWHSLDCPLNPVWVEIFLDRKEEAAKCRERRSNQRLLFDCVNLALLEIGQNTLKSLYLWSNVHGVVHTSPGAPVIDEVWGLIKHWFSDQGKCATGETDNASLVVDRAIRNGVEGRGWDESMRLEVDEIGKEIGGNLLDELVVEALAEFAVGHL